MDDSILFLFFNLYYLTFFFENDLVRKFLILIFLSYHMLLFKHIIQYNYNLKFYLLLICLII